MRGIRLRAGSFALGLCCAAPAAHAQGGYSVSIAPQAELRVTTAPAAASPGVRVTGRFLALSGDTLTMSDRRGTSVLAYPVAHLRRVEVRGDPDRRRGALIGVGLLGGIGVVFGGADRARGEIGTSEYVTVIVGNSIVGGLLGAALAPRRWTTVQLAR